MAAEKQMLFFETSAKKAENVDDCFMHLAQEVYSRLDQGLFDLTDESLGIQVLKPVERHPKPDDSNPASGCSC